MAGREIFKKRYQLQAFQNAEEGLDSTLSYCKTTNVEVTSSEADYPSLGERHRQDVWPPDSGRTEDAETGGITPPSSSFSTKPYARYTVNIASSPVSRPSHLSILGAPNSAAALQHRRNRAAVEANRAAWGYTKVALLFFVSLLVTWVPSSLNRVYSLANHGKSDIALSYVAGTVLSLMGFWNSVIYVVTTRAACKDVFFSVAMYRFPLFSSSRRVSAPSSGTRHHLRRGHSVTEIAHAMPDRDRSSSASGKIGYAMDGSKYRPIPVAVEDVSRRPLGIATDDRSGAQNPNEAMNGRVSMLAPSGVSQPQRVSWGDDWQRIPSETAHKDGV